MNKKGFTLIEVAVSVVLVSIVMVSLTATLVEIKKKSETVSSNTNAIVYSAVVSKALNGDIIKNEGIKFVECDVNGGECGLVLGNNSRRWLGIVDTTDKREASIYQDSADNNYYLKVGSEYIGVVAVEGEPKKTGNKINCTNTTNTVKANCLSVSINNTTCTCFKERISSTLIYLDNTPVNNTSLVTTNTHESNNQVANYEDPNITIKYIKTLSYTRTFRKTDDEKDNLRVSTDGYGFSRIYHDQYVYQDPSNAQAKNVLTKLTIGIYDGIDSNDQTYNVLLNSSSRIDKNSPTVGTKYTINLDSVGNLYRSDGSGIQDPQGVVQPVVSFPRAGIQAITRFQEKFNIGFDAIYYSSGESITIQSITPPTCSATNNTAACYGKTFRKYTTARDCAGVTVIDNTGKIVVPSNYFEADATIYACWQ